VIAFKLAGLLSIALVSACAVPMTSTSPSPQPTVTSAPAEQAQPAAPETLTIRLEIEIWDKADVRKVSPGVCALKKNNSRRQDVSFNESVVLVGPDDSEVASAQFERGKLIKTDSIDDGMFTNFPSHDICRFEATFRSVPPVDTYRVKFRGSGISNLSYGYDQVREYSGNAEGEGLMPMVFGAVKAD
jgi:hypothetical protein